MKYLLVLLLIAPLAYAEDEEPTYEEGYRQGYQLGSCPRNGNCAPVAAPAPPAPRAGNDTYAGGVVDGFVDAARKDK